MQTYVINRKYWLRGKYTRGGSALYKANLPDHNMCCLGFMCEQGGIPKEYLNNHELPSHISDLIFNIPSLAWMIEPSLTYQVAHNSHLVNAAYLINDNEGITEFIRERMLTELFFSHNIQLQFVGNEEVE